MSARRAQGLVALVAIVVACAGCSGKSPSILDTHGSESSRIAGVWWLMFGLGAVVYAVVAFFVVWAIIRGRRRKRLLVRANRNVDLQAFLTTWRARAGKPPASVRMVIDVDPYSFL